MAVTNAVLTNRWYGCRQEERTIPPKYRAAKRDQRREIEAQLRGRGVVLRGFEDVEAMG